jgi:tRNA(fMet)-specific endonuclease VapC
MILDTDVLSAIVSPRCPPRVARELQQLEGPLFTTAINWAEICCGLARHPAGQRLQERYRKLVLPAVEILPFDSSSAETYGELRATLEARGHRLGEADLMIAAVALRHRLPLVSGNARPFRRVPGLVLLDWLHER